MFVFVFNETLDDGIKLSRSRVKLLKKMARLFRDEDTRHIVLSKVDPSSLEVAWYNKTYSTRDCPVETIREARRFLLEREGSVRPRIVQAFEPSFHLADIKVLSLYCYSGHLQTWRPKDSNNVTTCPRQMRIKNQ